MHFLDSLLDVAVLQIWLHCFYSQTKFLVQRYSNFRNLSETISYIIPYRIVPYRIVSDQIRSDHFISYYIISYYIYHIISYHIILHILYHIILYPYIIYFKATFDSFTVKIPHLQLVKIDHVISVDLSLTGKTARL